MLIVDARHLRVEWLETERVLKKTCTGFVPSGVLRPGYEAVLACFQQHRGTKALSDNRQMWPTAREDLEWIERDWLPRMLEAGWRSWAVLEPATSLGAMNVRRWKAIYRERGITVETFEDEEAALAWLREQADQPPSRTGEAPVLTPPGATGTRTGSGPRSARRTPTP